MLYVYAACPVRVTVCSTGGKFRLVSKFTEFHALSPVTHSYALLLLRIHVGYILNWVYFVVLHEHVMQLWMYMLKPEDGLLCGEAV